MVLWKKYDTMTKSMVLYQKLWNFDILWEKTIVLWEKYGTIVNYSLL